MLSLRAMSAVISAARCRRRVTSCVTFWAVFWREHVLDELADETMIRRKRPPLDTVTDPTELIFRSTFKQQSFGESVSCLRSLPCVAACLVCQALVVAGFGLLLLGNTVSRFKQSPIVTYGCWPEAGCACDGRRSCN